MSGTQGRWHIAALDGVRAVAILLVMFLHSGLLPGGRIGVDLFFVLSGFLITSILLSEQQSYGSIKIGYFYARRALRLFPALFLMVACVVTFIAIWHPEQIHVTIQNAKWILTYSFNWLLVSQMPDLTLHQSMFSHVWSLSVEEQFYIVWPLFLAGIAVLKPQKLVVFVLLLIGVVAPSIARWKLWHGGFGFDLYFRTDLRVDGLFLGALVAWLTQNRFMPVGRWAWLMEPIGIAALLGLFWMSQYEMMLNDWAYVGGFTLANVFGAILIASMAWGPNFILRRLLSLSWLRWIGVVSYGLYLWHWPIMRATHDLQMDYYPKLILQFGLIFAITSLSFYLWERPWLKIKDRFERRAELPHAPGTQKAVG